MLVQVCSIVVGGRATLIAAWRATFLCQCHALPYNTQPCSAVDDLDNTEVLGATQTHDVGGSSHAYEHVQAYMDGGIDIDASRDEYEEFIDTDGPMDEAEVLDGT